MKREIELLCEMKSIMVADAVTGKIKMPSIGKTAHEEAKHGQR